MSDTEDQPPIINCHTHIFKGENVPPFLARSFVVWPFYYLFHVGFFLAIYRFFLRMREYRYHPKIRRWYRRIKVLRIRLRYIFLISIVKAVIILLALLHLLYILKDWGGLTWTGLETLLDNRQSFFTDHHLLWDTDDKPWEKMLLLGLILILIKPARKAAILISRQIRKWLALLPDKLTMGLIQRYLKLGRFALYRKQSRNLSVLVGQYPKGTQFVILPMDMEFMGAGKLPKRHGYRNQMQELADLKKSSVNKKAMIPFVFVDPRRIKAEKDFFRYRMEQGEVILEECFVQRYLEVERFGGIKIYPALGYYPFDEDLLPLWKYCADHGIPILTHCIRGTIFYRGKKSYDWNYHPVFKERMGTGHPKYGPLLLPEKKNKDFTVNFTHPLNYSVLLDEVLLREWLGKCSDRVKEVFGYTNPQTKLTSDLSALKICFGHYGGDDQWEKYLDSDFYTDSLALTRYPEHGNELIRDAQGRRSWAKTELTWKNLDWYSIISSMMIQHENVYADISYILHNKDVFPLLEQSIHHPMLGRKILFGTDFYVVRNHSTEKNLMVDTTADLSSEEFDLIARKNPLSFLRKNN